jgi:anti-anti-sigma regulatory factor
MGVRRPITYVSEFAVIITHIIGIARPIVRQVAMLMSVDGKLDAEEAENIGMEVSESLGNVAINIKGVDVLDAEAQELLARGLARLTYHVIQAVRYGSR